MINAEAENSQVVPAPVQTQHTWKEQRLLKQPVALNPAPLWFPSSARRLLNTTMSGSLIFPQKLQTIYVWTSEEKIETRLNDNGLFWCCDYLTQQKGNRVLFFNLFSLLFSPCWEKPRFCQFSHLHLYSVTHSSHLIHQLQQLMISPTATGQTVIVEAEDKHQHICQTDLIHPLIHSFINSTHC